VDQVKRQVDDAVVVFRGKYPHSTEEQVQLYAAAVEADLTTPKPPPEPDIPMPVIRAPVRAATTYNAPLSLPCPVVDEASPVQSTGDLSNELREILLMGRLPPDQRHRLQTEDMTENEILAMIVGAPAAPRRPAPRH